MDSEVRSLRSIGRRVRLVIPFERLRKMAPWLSGAFITFLGYLAVAWPSVLWLHHVANRQDVSASASPVAIPWLAPGVAVLCLMRYGIRAWPAVFAGSVVVWGVIQQSYVPLLVAESAGEALSVVLIVWLLKIWGFRPALDRYKDSLLLLAAVALGRMVSTTVDALSVVAAAAYASDGTVIAGLQSAGVVRTGRALIISLELFRFAGRWWLNTVAGCLLVVPLLALQTSRPLPRRGRYRLALATLSCGAALWIVGGFALPPGPLLPLMLLGALLLAVWATVQFGVAVAAAVTLVLALSATVGFGLQLGIFGGLNLDARVDVAWGFIGLLSGIALFLAALLSQREQARRQIAASAERYQRLFVGNPFPMWIEDAVSGRILLANPAALRVYGYDQAEFLSLTGGELRSDVGMHTRDDGSSVTTERHRTALGVNLEVEVTRVRMAVGGAPVRICFVEIQSECNELRLAILAAGDLERFRLGGVLQNKLMPLLASVVLHANELGSRSVQRSRAVRPLWRMSKGISLRHCTACLSRFRGSRRPSRSRYDRRRRSHSRSSGAIISTDWLRKRCAVPPCAAEPRTCTSCSTSARPASACKSKMIAILRPALRPARILRIVRLPPAQSLRRDSCGWLTVESPAPASASSVNRKIKSTGKRSRGQERKHRRWGLNWRSALPRRTARRYPDARDYLHDDRRAQPFISARGRRSECLLPRGPRNSLARRGNPDQRPSYRR
jgi:PAS domain-containing protein